MTQNCAGRFFLPILLWSYPLAACSAPPPKTETAEESDDALPVHDGKWFYVQNCAGCHNENGDGKGPTILELGSSARSFAQGGFAFGNSREAIFRTITSGLPGSSYMQSFKQRMTDEERWKVVDYVLTLTPAGEAKPAAGSVMKVGAVPAMAQGKLPPIEDKLPERPRGLLIGLPEGLTFEYRVDDVRLLGVRQGDFVDREDWNDRGGAALKPLGKVFYKFLGGDPPETFLMVKDGAALPLKASLKNRNLTKDTTNVIYVLSGEGLNPIAVDETLTAKTLSAGSSFTRTFHVEDIPNLYPLRVLVAGSSKNEKWARNGSWAIGEMEDHTFECVFLRGPENMKIITEERGVELVVDPTTGKSFSATIVLCKEWSKEQLNKLAEEMSR